MDNQTPPTNPIENPTSAQTPTPSPKSFFSFRIIFLIIIVLVLLGAGGTYLTLNSKPKSQPVVSKVIPTSTPTPPSPTRPTCSNTSFFPKRNDEIDGWIEFIDSYSCFALKHPKSWSYHESSSVLSTAAFIGNYDLNKIGGGEWDAIKDKGKLKIQITPLVTGIYFHKSPLDNEGIRVKSIEHYMELCCTEEGYSKLTIEGGKGYLAKKTATAVVERNGREFHISGLGFIIDSDKRLFDLTVSTFQFLDISPTGGDQGVTPKACTQEAKICPDGSYVGRQGPSCEFAKCPESP